MKIELKNIKHAEFASEETSCFSATVWVDGKKVAEVTNDGHGGSNNWYPWHAKKPIDEYGKTLPEIVSDLGFKNLETGAEETFTYAQDADTLVGDLLEKWLRERDLKKLLAKRVLFTVNDREGIFQTKPVTAQQRQQILARPDLVDKWNVKQFLNSLPFAEAMKLYESDGKDSSETSF